MAASIATTCRPKEWAQLVCSSDLVSDPVKIAQSKFVIGRSKNADLSLPERKVLSSYHCTIERTKDGRVILEDTSTNGTVINTTKLHNERTEIQHGDEIYFVLNKYNPGTNVSYVFQDLEKLEIEANADSSYFHNITYKEDLTDPESSDEEPVMKRLKAAQLMSIDFEQFQIEEVVVVTSPLSPVSAAMIDAGIAGYACQNQPGEHKSLAQLEPQPSTSKELCRKDEDIELEESLICVICHDIYHNAVSVQPCLHSFCGSCLCNWFKGSSCCPTCRSTTILVTKNHIVNNLVTAYLRKHPNRKRSQDELRQMDQQDLVKNTQIRCSALMRKINDQETPVARPGGNRNQANDDLNDDNGYLAILDYYDDSSSSSQHSDDDTTEPPIDTWIFMPPDSNPLNRCRQCPQTLANFHPLTLHGANTGVWNQSVTHFTCPVGQLHVLCQCCLKTMPDRRLQRLHNPDIPTQECSQCLKTYCSTYYGACHSNRHADNIACLAPLRGRVFPDDSLKDILLENIFETRILTDILVARGMTMADLINLVATNFESGEFTTSGRVQGFSPSSPVCIQCGIKNLRELAYQYRVALPLDQLPAYATTNRRDCYWGKNCRSQKARLSHAMKFNHICEQTRFN